MLLECKDVASHYSKAKAAVRVRSELLDLNCVADNGEDKSAFGQLTRLIEPKVMLN